MRPKKGLTIFSTFTTNLCSLLPVMKTKTQKSKPVTQPAPVAPVVALPSGKRAYGQGNCITTTFKHDGGDLASLLSSGKFRNQAEAIKWALRVAVATL